MGVEWFDGIAKHQILYIISSNGREASMCKKNDEDYRTSVALGMSMWPIALHVFIQSIWLLGKELMLCGKAD